MDARGGTASLRRDRTGALSYVEAVQLAALLEDCVERLQMLGDITPDILEHRQELAVMVGEEISRIIEDQRILEQRHAELLLQREESKSLTNKTKYREVQAEIKEIGLRLRQSTQVLCRNLKENPNVAENLLKIQQERQSLQVLLSKTVRELADCSFPKLLSTVEDDKVKQETLRETIEKEVYATNTVKRLASELEEEEGLKEQLVSKRNLRITELKAELHELKKETTENYNYQKKTYNALKYSRRRKWDEKQRELLATLYDLEQKIDVEVQCNKRIRDFLNRKADSLSSQKTKWDERYSEDFEQKTRELDSLQHQYSQTMSKFQALTETYQGNKEFVEADRRERKEAEAKRLFGIKMGRAAVKIQRVWRGYATRKAIAERNRKPRRKSKKKKPTGPKRP